MCLTIPGKIKEINKGIATVENGSRTAQIDLGIVFDAKVGDWILYATDRAVKKISEVDAKEIIALLEDHYHPVDVSKLPLKFKKIIFKVRSAESKKSKVKSKKLGSHSVAGSSNSVISTPQELRAEKSSYKRSLGYARDDISHDLTKDEIEYLLNLKGRENLETLFAEANSIRKEKIEDFVCIHGIIEFSNHCKNNCLYCGIRRDNKKLVRYRMSKDEIVEVAKNAVDKEGYKLLVLQSGEDEYYSDEKIIEIVKEIKKKMRVFIFLSVGERSRDFYKKALKVGVSGSLMRFETSNPDLYAKFRPGHKLKDRLDSIKCQQEMGYYMASGSLVGLPEQTISDIAEDLLTVKKLNFPMISAGPFIPSAKTPLFRYESNSEERIELFLKYVATARFLMPEVKIPVTTALETLDPKSGRHRGLLAGANALMFNLTPDKYAGNYNIYDNKYREREKVWQKYGLFKGEESYEMLEERLKI